MKILVVDDEKLLVKGVKFNLENEGYEVTAAYDGAAAVELAKKENFDLGGAALAALGASEKGICWEAIKGGLVGQGACHVASGTQVEDSLSPT